MDTIEKQNMLDRIESFDNLHNRLSTLKNSLNDLSDGKVSPNHPILKLFIGHKSSSTEDIEIRLEKLNARPAIFNFFIKSFEQEIEVTHNRIDKL